MFAPARLDREMPERFGRQVKPYERFLVTLAMIDNAIARIKFQTITLCEYDPEAHVAEESPLEVLDETQIRRCRCDTPSPTTISQHACGSYVVVNRVFGDFWI